MTGTYLSCAALLLATASTGVAQPPSGPDPGLIGTWQLVRYQGTGESSRTPDDPSRYTLEFRANGSLTARIDCNRGQGGWVSHEPGKLELKPLALTRMMCTGRSLHDQILEHWSRLRTYTVRHGRLILSLDGGAYEFEPAAAEVSSGPRQ